MLINQVEFSLKDLDIYIRYSGKDWFIKIGGEIFSKVEAMELAIKLQNASTELINYLERDIIKGLK
jgi:hypothetical protein